MDYVIEGVRLRDSRYSEITNNLSKTELFINPFFFCWQCSFRFRGEMGLMEEIWNNTKNTIREQMAGHTYSMWIEPMEFIRNSNGRIVLSCPNHFSKKKIQDNFLSLIESEILKSSGESVRVGIEVVGKKTTPIVSQPQNRQLILPNMGFQPTGGRLLRKDFTFERFVVGENNTFAYNASLSLASRTDATQSSLFLLSNTGLGKSHLSQAVGHYILSKYPNERVCYVTAEDFTNEMVNSFRYDTLDKFKEKYRNRCDVLIIEDIHFLAGKDRTQVELALALDYLFDADRKIIFTSCYPPSEIPKMNDQLKSRLSYGLIPRIEPPDFRTRIKILRIKAKEKGCCIPMEVTEYLAGELSENVRQLESGLIGVAAKSTLIGSPIDLNLAKSVVKEIAKKKKQITVNVIKKVVCEHFKISEEEIVSKSRKQKIARPRQIAMYLSRRFTDHTLQAIGKSFNRYHATTIRSIGVVERGIREGGAVQKQVEFLCGKLDAGNF